MTRPTKIPHGTHSRYVRLKCRCEPCRTANREYARDLRQRHRTAPETIQIKVPPEHGTYSRYCTGGCRCDLCRAANTAMRRDWRARIRTGAA